jgi:hypothetical protein
MPAKGPALSFDPNYVDFTVSAWQRYDLQPMTLVELQRLAAEQADHVFTEWSMMGMAEQHANEKSIKAAMSLLKSLKLLKQTNSGSRDARVTSIAPTPLGREILAEKPSVGNIYVGLVGLLVQQSPQLHTLLDLLEKHGPLSRPVASPVPGTPSKGTSFNRAVLDGLAHYSSQMASHMSMSDALPGRATSRQTATQKLKQVATEATQRHPTSVLPSLEKLWLLAADLGVVWKDVKQINQSLGIESIGPATQSHNGTDLPNIPRWEDICKRFTDVLLRVYLERVDSSGFVTIQALRGGIGRELHLSWKVVDCFLGLARDQGDQGQGSLTLQFEPNDDLLYAAGRQPLIWQGTAFDFVEVRRVPGGAGASSASFSSRNGDSSRPY